MGTPMSHADAKVLGAKILLLPRTLKLEVLPIREHFAQYPDHKYAYPEAVWQYAFYIKAVTLSGTVTLVCQENADKYIRNERNGQRRLNNFDRANQATMVEHLVRRMSRGLVI